MVKLTVKFSFNKQSLEVWEKINSVSLDKFCEISALDGWNDSSTLSGFLEEIEMKDTEIFAITMNDYLCTIQ